MYEIWHQVDDKLPVYHSTVVSETKQLEQSQQLAYALAAQYTDHVTVLLGKIYIYPGGRYFLKLR